MAPRKVSLDERKRGEALHPTVAIDRPRFRDECKDGPRPCPLVGCEHHLYLEVDPHTGTIKLNFPDLEPWELDRSCSLDEADKGPQTLEAVGERMNLTRERTRQIEVSALVRRRMELTDAED